MGEFEHIPKPTNESINLSNSEEAVTKVPKFSYDVDREEVALILPDGIAFKLEDVVVDEPNSVQSILTGIDKFTSQKITLEVIEDNKKLEVIKVTNSEGQILYSPTKH